MGFKIFLDVNIIIDFLDETRSENPFAINLFEHIENRKVLAFFSECVVNTSSYLLRKSFSIDTFKVMMNELLVLVKLLPCSNSIIQEAYHNSKNDLEDAVLYQIALEHKMDYFITSDIKDFKKIAQASLPVVSSKKMVGIINND
ncbi:MAG: type II toxin-antitoxin system VapC family toxin [Bacteroidetes bacterium]|nr:type II toxin-antitoxin system VapC family toxin [Bacteroidota bacterium]